MSLACTHNESERIYLVNLYDSPGTVQIACKTLKIDIIYSGLIWQTDWETPQTKIESGVETS